MGPSIHVFPPARASMHLKALNTYLKVCVDVTCALSSQISLEKHFIHNLHQFSCPFISHVNLFHVFWYVWSIKGHCILKRIHFVYGLLVYSNPAVIHYCSVIKQAKSFVCLLNVTL